MSETVLTSPIILDATGQDILTKLDSIISALTPNAQGVAYDKSGRHIITGENVQTALNQLDNSLNDTNASLSYKAGDVFATPNGSGDNIMIAGRVGWAGKRMMFSLTLDKPINNNVNSITFTPTTGASFYGCIYNAATDITTAINNSTKVINFKRGASIVTIQFDFSTAPLSINDGIVNLMVSMGFTLSFN